MGISRDDLNKRLCYLATNENLLAIKHGLEIKQGDSILSIAAAGDQAFSFLEFAKRVTVVDMNPKQLLYVKKQIELIRNKDFLSFQKPRLLMQKDSELGFEVQQLGAMNDFGLQQRAKYFTLERLHKIRANIDALVVSDADVLDALDQQSVNKLYLTNIIGYNDSDFTENHFLFACVNKLAVGGLAYISNGTDNVDLLKKMKELGLEKDLGLTFVARTLEAYWKPDVYKRIK